VSGDAWAFSFFDPERELYGTSRSSATILFEGRQPAVHPAGPRIEAEAAPWRAELEDRFAFELTPVTAEIELGAVSVSVCRVAGELDGRRLTCLGTLARTREAPRWDELDAIRSITALVDEGTGLLALARRPRGATGHGEEEVRAVLIEDGEPRAVEEARISTVYDGGGRQRSAGLELWVPGEELSRRGSGLVIAGSSLDMEVVQVHEAVFRWRLEGRDGIGAYELMVRSEPPAAA
jgi:hypothetical protein